MPYVFIDVTPNSTNNAYVCIYVYIDIWAVFFIWADWAKVLASFGPIGPQARSIWA